MSKLISLELKRNKLKSYNIAVAIIAVIMLGMLYMTAAIPVIDPSEAEGEFINYNFLISMYNLLSMCSFMVLSAVMYSKFIIEEYSGKKSLLLFSYPVARKKILSAKISMIFMYTVVGMFLSGVLAFVIFFATESATPLCVEQLSVKIVIDSYISLLIYSAAAGVWSLISLWFGFIKKSTSTTIVAAIIISVLICQFMQLGTQERAIGSYVVLAIGIVFAMINCLSIFKKVEVMEV